jgi:hypothetical protein
MSIRWESSSGLRLQKKGKSYNTAHDGAGDAACQALNFGACVDAGPQWVFRGRQISTVG